MPKLTLYTNPMSRGRIARWMLEEVGEPYEVVALGYGPPMRTPAFLALNPMGKVPTLVHGAAVVTEGAAICAYLADAFPATGLAPPPGDPARAAYYRWLFFGAGPVEAAVTNASLGVAVPADKRAMVGYGDMDSVLDAMTAALVPGPFLCGAQFTAADVYFGSQVLWGRQFGTLPDRPGFAAYAERLVGRPAHARASALDDALSVSA